MSDEIYFIVHLNSNFTYVWPSEGIILFLSVATASIKLIIKHDYHMLNYKYIRIIKS